MTVERVDRRPRVPKSDVTGLSLPSRGHRLVGVRVRLCSGWGAAIGQQHFAVEPDGRPKYNANNYRDEFETVRDDCEEGWMVFEIPRDSKPERVRFDFEDTGRGGPGGDDGLHAKFDWKVE